MSCNKSSAKSITSNCSIIKLIQWSLLSSELRSYFNLNSIRDDQIIEAHAIKDHLHPNRQAPFDDDHTNIQINPINSINEI